MLKKPDPEVMVLLSGGIDSTACVKFYINFGRPPMGLFIDYGQLAADREMKSAKAVADYYSIPLTCLTWRGCLPKRVGLIPARNLFLISAALMEKPDSVSVLAFGIHAGTNYPDSSESFCIHVQTVIDLYEQGKVQLAAPFVTWSKVDVYAYCQKERIPYELTYSCERGVIPPCGDCPSCRDREILHART